MQLVIIVGAVFDEFNRIPEMRRTRLFAEPTALSLDKRTGRGPKNSLTRLDAKNTNAHDERGKDSIPDRGGMQKSGYGWE